MLIRTYTDQDKAQLIALLGLNTPDYFHPAEETDFIEYLDKHIESYFVMEDAGAIVGAGGINYGFDHGKTARLSWDMIHPDYQGKGMGRTLAIYRINEIKKDARVKKIIVRTTQLVYKFYEKLGLQLEKIEKDYWAKGFDLYQMKMTI